MNQERIFILLKDYIQASLTSRYGIHLAKEMGLGAVLLAVEKITGSVHPASFQGDGLAYPKYADAKIQQKKILQHLGGLQKEFQSIWKEVYINASLGFSDNNIVQLTEERNPFLLLVEGQKEHTTFHDWFGVYETKIAEKADCPVLVVQPETNWKPIQKVLYIMDLEDAKMDNMRTLTTLCDKLNADLQVVFVSEKDIEEADGSYQRMVNDFKNILGFRKATYHRVFGEKNGDEIVGLVEALSPDWFAFEQKNKNFFQKLYDNYNTRYLILQNDIPVLVF